MKPHIGMLFLVISLAMVLGTVTFLVLHLQPDNAGNATNTILTLAGSVATIVGIIGGISQAAKQTPDPPQVTAPDPKGKP